MNMKQHILAALREQMEAWQSLLAGMDEKQVATMFAPSEWMVKDVVVHLWAWQQRTLARAEAAAADREPLFPDWPAQYPPESEDTLDELNAWIYETYRDQPWLQIFQQWLDGYKRLISLSNQVSEKDLLDSARYAWLDGYSLALVLLATYDHHQEHFDELQAWLEEHARA
jgi:hypothetical protein